MPEISSRRKVTYDKVQEDASIQEIVVLLDLLLRGLRLADREEPVEVSQTKSGWCLCHRMWMVYKQESLC